MLTQYDKIGKVKPLLAVAMAVSLTAGLTACGGNNEPSQQSNGAASPSASNAATESASPVEQAKLTVVGNGWDDASMEKSEADAKEAGIEVSDYNYLARKKVEADYPNYEVDWQNWGWAEQLDQKQRAAFISGSYPDIVHGETFMTTYAREGILEPLPQDIVDMVNPNFLVTNADGVPVAVSPKGNVFLLFYNKDLLKDAGIDPETVKLDTWADWQAASDQVTAAGNGKVFGGGIPSHPHLGGAFRVYPFLNALGGSWGGGDEVTLNTPEMAQTLEFVRAMDKNFPKGIGNGTDEGALYNMFEKDKTIAFVVNGTWQAAGAKNNNINYGVVQLPKADNGQSGNVLVGFDYYGVPAKSTNKEAAFNVIRDLVAKDVQIEFAIGTVTPPANKEALAEASVIDSNPILKSAIDAMSSGEIPALPVYDQNDSQIWDVINTKVIAATTMTSKSVEDILKIGQSEAEKYLKQ
ncbi:extracellular solute-binding protein [Cohnella fermenti]|uniref:Extracellular solute-binding protein n=1 Tax=Cohnella fermenti TaxID=2565925 RepID=A0A4S4BEN2_9BACL|nr:extracellular solute-binding protein [Cohnella fermenti]THF72680.1 extracellular solute-binding protein [Cohnella fermenti]